MDKQELLKEVVRLADEHNTKKQVVLAMLEDLEKTETVSTKHMDMVTAINNMMKEIGIIEDSYYKLVKQIRD